MHASVSGGRIAFLRSSKRPSWDSDRSICSNGWPTRWKFRRGVGGGCGSIQDSLNTAVLAGKGGDHEIEMAKWANNQSDHDEGSSLKKKDTGHGETQCLYAPFDRWDFSMARSFIGRGKCEPRLICDDESCPSAEAREVLVQLLSQYHQILPRTSPVHPGRVEDVHQCLGPLHVPHYSAERHHIGVSSEGNHRLEGFAEGEQVPENR
jgi:hypothetical protein